VAARGTGVVSRGRLVLCGDHDHSSGGGVPMKPWRSDPPEGDKIAVIAVIAAMALLAGIVITIGALRFLSGGVR
jgi:hypothetical protein